LFRITTDFTLLELTDFNHPLLRRMQLEAPGTYHHSLMVATLAEKAAADIGANPWLCRTAALFHDVGKLIKPEYFVENQRSGCNPHIDTHPNISALVIKSHIKEGVALAQEAGLPRAITDMICQHHGTTLIQYFYTKAIEQNHATDESLYRYDGPKPQSRESAILFLADAIEATSRTLSKVTPQTIHELVHSIFEDRLADQQLDETPLTLADLSKLKKSFILSLHTMLHARVAYPSGLPNPVDAHTAGPKV
jgi:putative nucleotidyltransferase with HDIG domain